MQGGRSGGWRGWVELKSRALSAGEAVFVGPRKALSAREPLGSLCSMQYHKRPGCRWGSRCPCVLFAKKGLAVPCATRFEVHVCTKIEKWSRQGQVPRASPSVPCDRCSVEVGQRAVGALVIRASGCSEPCRSLRGARQWRLFLLLSSCRPPFLRLRQRGGNFQIERQRRGNASRKGPGRSLEKYGFVWEKGASFLISRSFCPCAH